MPIRFRITITASGATEARTGGKGTYRWRAISTRGDSSSREREFERLYLETYGLVYNYVRYRMGNDPAVEDVVAEAYLLAARSFDRFDPSRSKFSTWVTTIAINCMNSHFRKAKPTVALDNVSDGAMAVQGGQSDVDDRLLVDQLLDALDAQERELVVMKYREGKRNVDIANELGMNQSTVSTKLANAIAKMRPLAKKGQGK